MLQTIKIRHHVTLFSQFSSTMGYLLQLYTVPVQCQTNDADLLPLENTGYTTRLGMYVTVTGGGEHKISHNKF